jgi:hypothetical protein
MTGEAVSTWPAQVCPNFGIPPFTGACVPPAPATKNFTVHCDADGSGTMTFSVTGAAAGPYPGTFSESGTLSWGPPLVPFPGPYGRSQVVSFNATFHIDSPLGTIDGTKSLSLPAGSGFCGQSQGGLYYQSQAVFIGDYQATVQPATGPSFTDTGQFVMSTYALTQASPVGQPRQAFDSNLYQEFASTGIAFPGPDTVVLTPPTAVNPVGTTHTVTATTTSAGTPAPGFTVYFTVAGSVTTTGQCTTDQEGQCTFTYTGPALPGADLITGCADADDNGGVDPGEPCAEATKIWSLPASTPGQVTGGGQVAGPTGEIVFGFNARNTDKGAQGQCNVVDRASDVHVKCEDVTVLVQGATHATFFGNGTLDGVPVTYRIDVDDLGEPGAGRDTFTIQTSSGYMAGGVLTQGNIQIHE